MKNTMNSNKTRCQLLEEVRNAAAALDMTAAKADEVTWSEGLDASKTLDNALVALNRDALENAFDAALNASNPAAALCKAAKYSKAYVRKNKDGVREVVFRDTRLSLSEFLKYAAENGRDLTNVSAALNKAAAAMASYVADSLNPAVTPSTRAAKIALQGLLSLLSTDEVKLNARSVDIRFIVYACTRARSLGELAEITPAAVAPFLADVVTVQTRGMEYTFEKKEEKAE